MYNEWRWAESTEKNPIVRSVQKQQNRNKRKAVNTKKTLGKLIKCKYENDIIINILELR